jgi:hypothetical protein
MLNLLGIRSPLAKLVSLAVHKFPGKERPVGTSPPNQHEEVDGQYYA